MFSFKIYLLFSLGYGICFAQRADHMIENSYINEFFFSGPYHHDSKKNIKPIELLEVDFINNEANFNNLSHEGFFIQSENGEHDLNLFLDDSSNAVVYLHTNLNSQKAGKFYLLLSITDGVKIYINGSLITAHYGNNYHSDGKLISSELKSGNNSIVIKTVNKDWDWKLKLKVLDNDHGKVLVNKRNKEGEKLEFLYSNVKPEFDYGLNYVFKVGSFPNLILDKPGLAREYLGGSYTIDVRWFDTNVVEVLYPEKVGRYGFYAHILGENGIVLKRGGTLFCVSSEDMIWNNRLNTSLTYFPVNSIPKEVWVEHQEAINYYMGHLTLESLLFQSKATTMFSFLHEMNNHKYERDKKLTPLIFDGDYHAKIKQKILAKENTYPRLELPKKVFFSSKKLMKKEASYEKENPQFIDLLRRICNEWIEDDGSPFDMVLAKDGEIIFHDSFGEDDYGIFTINTPSEIASITKLFTGMLFAQFVDQNIIKIDDPVGKYLPDFPIEGPQAMTLRQCFTHTSGFDGHALFDGVHNPWLENTLFQYIKNDTVGLRYNYNGMGFDLAGKVMEVVSGKSVFRLFHEYIYEPLGMKNTYHTWDLGFSVHSTAYDLSILAQMLLNKGTYDGKKYFSERTYGKILPQNLKTYFPNITYSNPWDKDRPIGIGTTLQEWKIKDKDSKVERYMLSENVIGHGSATSSVFRIDLDNKIIITQTRRRGKSKFGDHFEKMYLHIDNYLVKGEN